MASDVPLSPAVSRRSSLDSSVCSDDGSMFEFSASYRESEWALLVTEVANILGSDENALQSMKRMLQQRVQCMPLKKPGSRLKKLKLIVDSPEYKNAASVGDLFDLLAPCWNWRKYELLELLIKASHCKAAEYLLQKFLAREFEVLAILPTDSRADYSRKCAQKSLIAGTLTVFGDKVQKTAIHIGKEMAEEVVKEGGEVAMKELGQEAVEQVVRHGAEEGAKSAAKSGAKTLAVIGFGAGCVVETGMCIYSVSRAYKQFERGEINRDEYNQHKRKRIGGAMGSTIGSAVGGAVGTLIPIPVVGTLAGSVVGGVIGDVVGSFTGDYIGQ